MIVAAFFTGAALGAFFYVGLLVTVRKVTRVKSPGLLTAASFFARSGAAAFVFYLFAKNGGWIPVLVCAAGFILARVLVRNLTAGRTTGEPKGGTAWAPTVESHRRGS
jgi:F1F0 ATPase subunit 2